MDKYQFYGSRKFIVAALTKNVDEMNYDIDDPDVRVYEFTDPKKFGKYIMADFIFEIAEKCNFEFANLDKNRYMFPDYHAPDGKDNMAFFEELLHDGLIKRYGEITPEIEERVNREKEMIVGKGFVNYFLTVRDYINAAREMGISVGPGRGSGAGSVVAFALGITSVNPLKYDLLFERFLHNERVSAPDFDIDFAAERREEVVEYVRKWRNRYYWRRHRG